MNVKMQLLAKYNFRLKMVSLIFSTARKKNNKFTKYKISRTYEQEKL